MPKSKVRKKTTYTATTDRRSPQKVKAAGPSHPAYLTVMFGLALLGLAWMVVYYLASDRIAFIGELGVANFAIGFGLIITSLLMMMRWR